MNELQKCTQLTVIFEVKFYMDEIWQFTVKRVIEYNNNNNINIYVIIYVILLFH